MFEPVIVPKRRRRLNGVDVLVCSLSAKGLTHGEISAHLAEIYGARVSKETIKCDRCPICHTPPSIPDNDLKAGNSRTGVIPTRFEISILSPCHSTSSLCAYCRESRPQLAKSQLQPNPK